jgi:hypothetical protein
MKHLFLYILLFSFAGFAQQQPTKVKYAKSINSFVPKGWKIIATDRGDLNKDGTNDVALVIEDTKKENFIANGSLGSPTLNLNPRTLIILFKYKPDGSYSLGAKQDTFIPLENDEENSCLADPLLQDGGIDIVKGNLIVSLNYWLSCGSYEVIYKQYTFRYQDNGFALIGYDTSEYSRSSGEMSHTSVNFLTNKKSTTTGENMFEDDKSKHKTSWKPIKIDRLLTLTDLNRTLEIDF